MITLHVRGRPSLRRRGRAHEVPAQQPLSAQRPCGLLHSPVLRPRHRRTPPPRSARNSPPTSLSRRRPRSAPHQTRTLPQPPAQLRHPPARGRLRHPHHPRAPRSPRRRHHYDLHARPQPRPLRRPKPLGCRNPRPSSSTTAHPLALSRPTTQYPHIPTGLSHPPPTNNIRISRPPRYPPRLGEPRPLTSHTLRRGCRSNTSYADAAFRRVPSADAISLRVAPAASNPCTSRSSDTPGSPASIFATRDWLDPIRFARSI
jgi:hypothetical protein